MAQPMARHRRSNLSSARDDRTLWPAALIKGAFVRLIDQSQPIPWENQARLFGIAARHMRLVLVDYARAHWCEKRGGGPAQALSAGEDVYPLAGSASLRYAVGMLWAAVFLLAGLAGGQVRLPPSDLNRVAVGTLAPDFELPSASGGKLRLSSLRGKNVVLVFYRGYW